MLISFNVLIFLAATVLHNSLNNSSGQTVTILITQSYYLKKTNKHTHMQDNKSSFFLLTKHKRGRGSISIGDLKRAQLFKLKRSQMSFQRLILHGLKRLNSFPMTEEILSSKGTIAN